ncbi:MAG: DUF5667 domain-containing protein [Candidatus Roizmanbacteria bacterium]
MSLGRIVFIFLSLFVLVTSVHLYVANAQQLTLMNQEDLYDLPYPGILPDHPLYFIKDLRDKTTLFFTRDIIKGAELNLLNSDKKIAMAEALSIKGKDKLMVDTAIEAETAFLAIPAVLKEAKEQGSSPSSEFILRLKSSNTKHREVLESLVKRLPQVQQKTLNDALQKNVQGMKEIDNIK